MAFSAALKRASPRSARRSSRSTRTGASHRRARRGPRALRHRRDRRTDGGPCALYDLQRQDSWRVAARVQRAPERGHLDRQQHRGQPHRARDAGAGAAAAARAPPVLGTVVELGSFFRISSVEPRTHASFDFALRAMLRAKRNDYASSARRMNHSFVPRASALRGQRCAGHKSSWQPLRLPSRRGPRPSSSCPLITGSGPHAAVGDEAAAVASLYIYQRTKKAPRFSPNYGCEACLQFIDFMMTSRN